MDGGMCSGHCDTESGLWWKTVLQWFLSLESSMDNGMCCDGLAWCFVRGGGLVLGKGFCGKCGWSKQLGWRQVPLTGPWRGGLSFELSGIRRMCSILWLSSIVRSERQYG